MLLRTFPCERAEVRCGTRRPLASFCKTSYSSPLPWIFISSSDVAGLTHAPLRDTQAAACGLETWIAGDAAHHLLRRSYPPQRMCVRLRSSTSQSYGPLATFAKRPDLEPTLPTTTESVCWLIGPQWCFFISPLATRPVVGIAEDHSVVPHLVLL